MEKGKQFMQQHLVTIIIPAYNEENTIADVIEDTANIMQVLSISYEIILVNDGSTDRTEQAALSTHKAHVLTNKENKGKGYSLRRALTYARGDIIVTLDGDGEHKPKEIPSLLNPVFEGTDVVSGSRFLGSQSMVTTRINRIGNSLFNAAIMALTGSTITDSQTGFRAMRRDIVDKLKLQSDGYNIEAEISVKSLRNGFSFMEVPISVTRRKYSTSKIRLFSDGQKILSTIIRSSFMPIETDHPGQSTNRFNVFDF